MPQSFFNLWISFDLCSEISLRAEFSALNSDRSIVFSVNYCFKESTSVLRFAIIRRLWSFLFLYSASFLIYIIYYIILLFLHLKLCIDVQDFLNADLIHWNHVRFTSFRISQLLIGILTYPFNLDHIMMENKTIY